MIMLISHMIIPSWSCVVVAHVTVRFGGMNGLIDRVTGVVLASVVHTKVSTGPVVWVVILNDGRVLFDQLRSGARTR